MYSTCTSVTNNRRRLWCMSLAASSSAQQQTRTPTYTALLWCNLVVVTWFTRPYAPLNSSSLTCDIYEASRLDVQLQQPLINTFVMLHPLFTVHSTVRTTAECRPSLYYRHSILENWRLIYSTGASKTKHRQRL